MNALYEVTDTSLICQWIGCAAGLCVSILLIQLIRATWRFRAQRRPGILLIVAMLVWNLGGLIHASLIMAGFGYRSSPVNLACAFGYTGLAILTWAILDVWSLSVEGVFRKKASTFIRLLAVIFGALTTVWLWTDALGAGSPASRTGLRILGQISFYLLVGSGVGLAVSNRSTRTARICGALTSFGLIGPLTALFLLPIFNSLPQAAREGLAIYSEQSVNYLVVAAFILLARLRYTDVLVERALRCLTAIFAGAVVWYGLLRHYQQSASMAVAATVSLAGLVLLAPAVNRLIRRLTERMLQQWDFDVELDAMVQSIRKLSQEAEMFQLVESTLVRLLQFQSVRVLAAAVSDDFAYREIVENQPGSGAIQLENGSFDAVVPVGNKGIGKYLVAIARSGEQRGFLASEVSFLLRVAKVLADRLESICIEREKSARDQREATLSHQTTEAELRALRAQINPHFLFNSLNTIADLIVVDAQKAERMTERLADVFRYLLAHSQRPTITVREEMEFLQRYLEIEEARFRDRLQVRIDVDPSTEGFMVPALILQPIVENALKHGLGPKLTSGTLAISAKASNHDLILMVEDDGVGFQHARNGNAHTKSTGLGLTNTNQRLRTLYGDRAKVVMESPDQNGCRVTISIQELETCVL